MSVGKQKNRHFEEEKKASDSMYFFCSLGEGAVMRGRKYGLGA